MTRPIKYMRVVILMATAVYMLSCASVSTNQTKQEEIFWPPPPEVPRIKYEYSFEKAEELGINKGFWKWLGELFTGEVESQMIRPMAITVNSHGILFIADPGIKGVHRFDINNHKYDVLMLENGVELPSPVALTSDAEGNVYISDSELGHVYWTNSDSEYIKPLIVSDEIKQPTGLVFDDKTGNLFVVDTAQHQVFIYHQNDLIKRFGGRGEDTGQFNFPTMISLFENKYLLITDSLNFRIQMFDLDGNYISHFGKLGDGSGSHARPKGVATDTLGHVYVVDSLFHNVQIFDQKGALLLDFGEQGNNKGQFWLPTGIFIDQQNKIYVADSYNRRVQVFRYLNVEP